MGRGFPNAGLNFFSADHPQTLNPKPTLPHEHRRREIDKMGGGVHQKLLLARFDNTGAAIRSPREINYSSWNGPNRWPRSADTVRAMVLRQ
jgi:hypothetical protein